MKERMERWRRPWLEEPRERPEQKTVWNNPLEKNGRKPIEKLIKKPPTGRIYRKTSTWDAGTMPWAGQQSIWAVAHPTRGEGSRSRNSYEGLANVIERPGNFAGAQGRPMDQEDRTRKRHSSVESRVWRKQEVRKQTSETTFPLMREGGRPEMNILTMKWLNDLITQFLYYET